MLIAFSLLFFLICAIIILVPALLGIKRGTVKAGAKLVCAIFAAIIAFIVCKVSTSGFKSMFVGILSDVASSNETFAGVVESLDEETLLASVIIGMVSTIVMPFVFILVYSIVNFIFGIASSIAFAVVEKKGIDFSKIINVGWAIGIVQGVLSVIILMMPLVGLMSFIDPFMDTAISNENAANVDVADIEDLEDIGSDNVHVSKDGSYTVIWNEEESLYMSSASSSSDPADSELLSKIGSLCDSVPVKIVGALGAKPLYRSLTSFKVDGVKISLLDEAQNLAACLDHLDPLLSTELVNYSKRQASALRLLSYDLQQSELTMLLVGDMLPEMSKNWLEDKDYLGISAPSFGKDLDPLMDKLFEITSLTTRKTVREDVASMFEIVAIICENGTLRCIQNTDELLENLSQEGYISKLLAATYGNKRMSPLVIEITNLGIRSVGTTLKIPENTEEVYENLMQNVSALVNETSSVTSKEERQSEIYEKLDDCFKQAGVEVTKDERAVIAYYLIDQFGASGDISYGQIEDFFKSIQEGFEDVDATVANEDGSFVFASETFSDLSVKIYEFYSGKASIVIKIKTASGYDCLESSSGKVIVTEHSVDDQGNHVANVYQLDITEKKNVFDNLSSAEDFKCDGKTIQSMLVVSTDALDKLDEKEVVREFERLEQGIVKIVEFICSLEDNGSEMADANAIESLGNALQELSTNKLLGEGSCNFIEGALKSEFVLEKVDGLDSSMIDDVMDNLRNEDGNSDTDFSLGNTLASGTKAAELVSSLGKDQPDDTEPDENVEQSVVWLIENMSASSADVICKMITPAFVKGHGLVNGDLNHICEMLKELFTQMANSESMSEQEYKKEAHAIQNLYDLMIKASKDSDGSVFVENEKDGITAKTLVDNLMSSRLVLETVCVHAYKNGDLKIDFLCFGSESFSDSDKKLLSDAVVDYYYDNQNKEDKLLERKLRALSAMFAIKLDFDNGEAVVTYPYTPGMNPLKYSDGYYTYSINGELVKGWADINGKLYYFDSMGHALIGWNVIGENRYYFTVEGGASTGIVSVEGTLYMFGTDGVLVKLVG